MQKTNQTLLDELTAQQRAAVLDGSDAVRELDDFRRKTFDLWMRIARGVAALCIVADRPGMSRKARINLFKDNGYATLNGGTVSRLLRMAEYETAIRAWRDTLTANKRDSWNSPTSICNRCPVVRKAIAEASVERPRKPRSSNGSAALERALDAIGDYLHGVEDADHRAAVVERLMTLARQFTLAPERKPAAKPKAGKPKAPKDLVWKEQGLGGDGDVCYTATANGGEYRLNPSLAYPSLKSMGYTVVYVGNPSGKLRERNDVRIAVDVKTADKAKAIAQADFIKRVLAAHKPKASKYAKDLIEAAKTGKPFQMKTQ